MLCEVTRCAGRISANIRPHQLQWGDQKMGTAISCTKCSQVAGLIQKVGRSSSEASSLRAPVLRAAVLRAAALRAAVLRAVALRAAVLRATVLRATVLCAAVLRATVLRAAVFCSKSIAIAIVTCY